MKGVGMYHYREGGLRNVWLANGYQIKKTPFGAAVAIEYGVELEAELCRALSRKPAPLTGGELRFLRLSGFKLSQQALASMLGCDAQSLARWEKSRPPRGADRLVRLLYAAHAHGDEPICAVVGRLQAIERAQNTGIEMRKSKGAWQSTFRDRAELETA
jgi:DNA-binding transcriptional regulator YiaG